MDILLCYSNFNTILKQSQFLCYNKMKNLTIQGDNMGLLNKMQSLEGIVEKFREENMNKWFVCRNDGFFPIDKPYIYHEIISSDFTKENADLNYCVLEFFKLVETDKVVVNYYKGGYYLNIQKISVHYSRENKYIVDSRMVRNEKDCFYIKTEKFKEKGFELWNKDLNINYDITRDDNYVMGESIHTWEEGQRLFFKYKDAGDYLRFDSVKIIDLGKEELTLHRDVSEVWTQEARKQWVNEHDYSGAYFPTVKKEDIEKKLFGSEDLKKYILNH